MTLRRTLTNTAAAAALTALMLPAAAVAEDAAGANTMGASDQTADLSADLANQSLRVVESDSPDLIWPDGWTTGAEAVAAMVDDMDIIGSEGDQIGEVEGLLVNEANEVVAFAVETEGFLDIGDEDVILPLGDAQLSPDGDAFLTSLTEDELEAMPEWED